MTAKHETIHIGTSEIRGEQNEVIKWKLHGRGWTTYEPVVSGTLTFTGSNVTATATYRILALGDTRVFQMDTLTWSALSEAAQLVSGAIDAAHRPNVGNMVHTAGTMNTTGSATAQYNFIIDLATTGVVTLRGYSRNSTGYGIGLVQKAGSVQPTTIVYSVA